MKIMYEEITIRPLKVSDKSQLASLANNKKIWDNVRNILPHPYSEDDALFFINLTKDEDPKVNFGIEYKGQLCGAIGLVLLQDVYSNTAELGYWLGEPFWGKGITTFAINLITQYGFEVLNLRRIHASIFDFNLASMKVLEKNGYVKEGVSRKAIIKNGVVCDEHRYAKWID